MIFINVVLGLGILLAGFLLLTYALDPSLEVAVITIVYTLVLSLIWDLSCRNEWTKMCPT
jgi:hypothetical protein